MRIETGRVERRRGLVQNDAVPVVMWPMAV